MGEHEARTESEEVRLQRESERLLAELKAKLNELDRVRGRKNGLVTPEQRRRSFRLIKGGAVAAALAAGWQVIRRPQVAAASMAGAAGLVAMPVTIDPPPLPPAYSLPPIVIEWGDEERVPPHEQGGEDEIRVPVAKDEPEPTPEPEPEPEPEPPETVSTPAPQPQPSLSPVPKPTATVTATASPTLELTEPVEVDVDVSNGVCLDAGLVGVDLASCVGK
jgi:hypothetical protein